MTQIRETSAEAYKHLVESGKLAKANRAVYVHLFHNGPTTQKKTERALGDTTYTMRPRFAQLEKMGVIKFCGKYVCPETNRTNMLWDVTPLIEPNVIDKTPPKFNKATVKSIINQMNNEEMIFIDQSWLQNLINGK